MQPVVLLRDVQRLIIVLAIALINAVVLMLPSGAVAAPGDTDQSGNVAWQWADESIAFVSENSFIAQNVVDAGGANTLTRQQWVDALVALDSYRATQTGETPQMSFTAQGTELHDVDRSSTYARAVRLGWIKPISGRFSGNAPVTADEASVGIVRALGLGPQLKDFSNALKREVPGAKSRLTARAAQVFTRSLGMRYNHLQGYEDLETSPNEPVKVGQAAFMLQRAALLDEWRLAQIDAFATFDIPDLNDRQKRVMKRATKLIGYPYVWAGETENMQEEGHGGFDCSGFTWRVMFGSGLGEDDLFGGVLAERTSYAMSAIPRKQRIKDPNQLQPGDIMFWGSKGGKSKPSQNYHAGISMGNGWFIHSSGSNGGVTITRLEGYWLEQFSWGRKYLR